MSKIKIGWSEVDITPKKGTKIGLAGQFFERITDEVESPISVTAFALESGDDQMIICSCDLVGVGDNLNKIVKDRLAEEGTVNPDKVILSSIHTHTSYVYTRKTLITTESGSFDYLKKVIPEDMAYRPLVSSEERMDPDVALEFLANKIVELKS